MYLGLVSIHIRLYAYYIIMFLGKIRLGICKRPFSLAR